MVVTGGLGALGALVASWLSRLGACDLLLLGRSGRASKECNRVVTCAWLVLLSSQDAADMCLCMRYWPLSFQELHGLSAGGDSLVPQLREGVCQVFCVKGDVACAEETACILAGTRSSSETPLHGIMHAGAALESKVISNIRIDGIRTEFSGKKKTCSALI